MHIVFTVLKTDVFRPHSFWLIQRSQVLIQPTKKSYRITNITPTQINKNTVLVWLALIIFTEKTQTPFLLQYDKIKPLLFISAAVYIIQTLCYDFGSILLFVINGCSNMPWYRFQRCATWNWYQSLLLSGYVNNQTFRLLTLQAEFNHAAKMTLKMDKQQTVDSLVYNKKHITDLYFSMIASTQFVAILMY